MTIDTLRNPAFFLPRFGTLLDQRTDERVRYDPDRICPPLHNGVLDYFAQERKTAEGRNTWLVVLASRQTGKSSVCALSTYTRIAYTPGAYGAVMADNKERAEDLFRTISHAHENVPEQIRSPTIRAQERRQLTFANPHGGKIRTLSAGAGMVGIGRAVSAMQLSECPFYEDGPTMFNGLLPAMINRDEAICLLESTPAPLSLPSAPWFRDICEDARAGLGRWEYLFVPFYQSRLNERVWNRNWRLTNEEVKLLERYGDPSGRISGSGTMHLTVENLAFRRAVMDMDVEVRRAPQLFQVYYPFDDATCWVESASAAVPERAMDALISRSPTPVPWNPEDGRMMIYREPHASGVYSLGGDPCGWTGGDPACLQVLECWENRWRQAATLNTNEMDPTQVAEAVVFLARKYNQARITIESNGVGMGVLAPLYQAYLSGEIRNLYFSQRGASAKPGISATKKSIAEGLGLLIDAMMSRLELSDAETIHQLKTYRNDRAVRESETFQILNAGKTGSKRRERHHYDRVVALMWAVVGAQDLPVRYEPATAPEGAQEVTDDPSTWTNGIWEKLRQEQEKQEKAAARARRKSAKHWTAGPK